ncbi:l-allo-threonine aldolase [Cadophora sp. MPI-SDFR-AT-0126]|nr:l-allo-threonine aldolase [Leotiomycetes sp. MPI-SDFR-AT-0126]
MALFRSPRASIGISTRQIVRVTWQRRWQGSQAAQTFEKRQIRDQEDETEQVISLLQSNETEWNNPGSAQFDFRSDVVTRPTMAMLLAIMKTTLQDDVYREDFTTSSLENHVARLAGHEAGLFVLSGTMANQLALRTHLNNPPESLMCDARSHIIHWEAGGLANTGAMIQSVAPRNGEFLTLEDIKAKAILTDDVHKSPTTVISLENTIFGLVHPLSETRRIAAWARQNGLRLHLDGARLWEAVATGAGSVRDYGECFHSLSLDFSKGLGAPMGAMILGTEKFINRARRIRKGMGGGMRQSGVLSAAAWAALDNFHKLSELHRLTKTVADMWISRGGRLRRRTETNLVWIDLTDDEEFRQIGHRYGIQVDGCRIVLHHQISHEAINRLRKVFDTVLASGAVSNIN